ncbi:MAG: hypothetical protein AAGH67_17620, partial [Cyanobacteria bacterium P01_H01_bin.162]
MEELQAIATEQAATLVEYSITAGDLNIWVLKPTGEIEFTQVDLQKHNLDQLVKATRDGMFIEPYYP